jgi:heat-inducible transcriptional repressor
MFDAAASADAPDVVLGQPSLLAEQPEFATGERMRRLLELTETPEELGALLRRRATSSSGLSITIGAEHADPRLEPFTVVTAEYRAGGLAGVIGVIGPTRMPYDKVISLVSHTSRLISDLLH